MTDEDIREEFIDILEQHIGIIIKISRAYIPDHEERKDLIQDIILELWKSHKRFNGSCKISTWIYRITLNISMNYKRKRIKEIPSTPLSSVQEKDIGLWIDEQNNTAELDVLYSCIDELNEINKAIILLYLDGNSHTEIAEITGISKTNVGTRISRIKLEINKISISKKEEL